MWELRLNIRSHLYRQTVPKITLLQFFAEYWLPEYPYHIIKQGVIEIKVNGSDKTPPKIKWVKIHADNVLQARIYDGSKIRACQSQTYFEK